METIIDKSLQKLKDYEYDEKKRDRIIEKRYYSSRTEKEDAKIPREEILRVDGILREKVLLCWDTCEKIYENLKPQLQGKHFRISGQIIPKSDEEHIPGWEWLFHDCNINYRPPTAVYIFNGTEKEFQQTDIEKLGLFSEDDTYGSETFPGKLQHTLPVCLVMKRIYEDCKLTLTDIVRLTGFDIKYAVEIKDTKKDD